MPVLIRFRRGSTVEWTAKNPVLESGEPGYDLTTGDLKVGDGVTAFTELPTIGGMNGLHVQEVTQAEYDAIPVPRPSNILYIITP